MTSIESNTTTLNISDIAKSNTDFLNSMASNFAGLNETDAHSLIKRFKSDHFNNSETIFDPSQLKNIKSLSNAINLKKTYIVIRYFYIFT